jgi:hypothetical protein
MRGFSWGQLLTRALLVIGGLLMVGIVLRLLLAILSPVLPAWFMGDLGKGWELLYSLVSPAMPAVMAAGILAALCWVVIGRSR